MSVNVQYKTTARATGGRVGHAETLDGQFKVDFAAPKELGGNGQGNNPEQLFAAGYAACFLGAMKFVAQQEKLSLPEQADVQVTVGLGPRSDGGFGLEVSVKASLPGLDKAQAKSLIEKTEHVCPYANATKNNIKTTFEVS